jgi:prefoldin subunit 5
LNETNDVKDNELEQIAVEAITDTNENKKQIKIYISELKSEIKALVQRCDQFNDVKQTIKSMNDLIREEVS